MASIHKRDGKYRVSIRKKGMPQVSKSFHTEQEAIEFARETEESFNLYTKELSIPNFPLSVWIDRYIQEEIPNRKQPKSEVKWIEFWKDKLGKEVAHKIAPGAIELAADCILQKKKKTGKELCGKDVRRRHLLWLSHLYTIACKKWKWAKDSPFTCIEMRVDRALKPKHEIKNSSLDEFRVQLNKFIDESGLSDVHGAKKCALSKTTYQNLRSANSSPTLSTLIQALDAFGLKLSLVKL